MGGVLLVTVGNAQGPSSLPPEQSLFLQNGVLGASGLADVWLPLPRSLPAGVRLWTRVLIGAYLSPYQVVTVQEWASEDPEHGSR